MASAGPPLRVKKGSSRWRLAEQIRISPAPKMGSLAGGQMRFLSIRRGESVITDLEQGSLAEIRRRTSLPRMHQMWFHPEGHSLGYTKRQKIGNPSDLYFLDREARLVCHCQLPDAASEIAAGPGQWYVGCRDGALYAFCLEGGHQWDQRVPYGPRDGSINAELGLPVFHPYLTLTAVAGGIAVGAEDEICVFNRFGKQTAHWLLPARDSGIRRGEPMEMPLHEERLGRLGIPQIGAGERVRTGYLRFALDTTQGGGWVKQADVFDEADGWSCLLEEDEDGHEDESILLVPSQGVGITTVRSAFKSIFVGTRDGLLHTFSDAGLALQTFQLGPHPVTDILADEQGLKAAYSAGRLTLFDGRQITGSVVLPEHFAELALCGELVLAWRWTSAWLVARKGQVVWAGEAEKPIRAAWGDGDGFCVLAGQLFSIRQSQAGQM